MIGWQPPTAEELIQQWQSHYKNAQPDILGHLARAKLILMDRNYGHRALEAVQQQMVLHNQSLDAYLNNIEHQQGFQPREVVNDLLSRDDFQAHLRVPRHIFDVGTPFDHGPHTHRLQGCILYQAHTQNQLGITPTSLYYQLGQQVFQDPKNPLRTIWDDIFDFDEDAQILLKIKGPMNSALEYAAFSSPEWTLPYLISQQFPPGPLQQELRLIRFRQRTFGRESILDFAQTLRAKISGLGNVVMGIDQLETLYQQQKDPEYFQKRDKALAGL